MAKDLIENQIIDYYDINNYLNKGKKIMMVIIVAILNINISL